VKRSASYPKKRYALQELDAGEGPTDALKWVERELIEIDRLLSDALSAPKKTYPD
jgi:hypothetical protein